MGVVQFDPVVGDVAGNRDRIAREYRAATRAGADLVVTPELSLLGYPPRDLLYRSDFLAAAAAALAYLMVTTITYPDLLPRDAFIMGAVQGLAVAFPGAVGRTFPYALFTLAVAYLLLAPRLYWRPAPDGAEGKR